jgi:hypothetical protein
MKSGLDPLLVFVEEFKRQHDGTSPTNGQMSVRFGLSEKQVSDALKERIGAGLLTSRKTNDWRKRVLVVHALGVVS